MTTFGFFAASVLLLAFITGVCGGLLANYLGDPVLAWMSGGVASAPLFLILGRVWVRSEIEAIRHEQTISAREE